LALYVKSLLCISMKIKNQVKILITKTNEPNALVDELIEKLCRTGKKYNVELEIIPKICPDP